MSLAVFVGAWAFGVTGFAQEGTEALADTSAVESAADPGDVDSLDKEARSLFEAGLTAYNDGRFEAALEHFKRAYELSDRPQLLFNIAQAADRLRMDDEALAALRAYRERLPNAGNRGQVDSRIRTLEARREEAATAEPTSTPRAEVAPPPVQPAPTPISTAIDRDLRAASTGPGPARNDDGGGVLSQWWFWAATGAVVAAVAVGVLVAASGDDAQPQATKGTDGLIIVTLSQ